MSGEDELLGSFPLPLLLLLTSALSPTRTADVKEAGSAALGSSSSSSSVRARRNMEMVSASLSKLKSEPDTGLVLCIPSVNCRYGGEVPSLTKLPDTREEGVYIEGVELLPLVTTGEREGGEVKRTRDGKEKEKGT